MNINAKVGIDMRAPQKQSLGMMLSKRDITLNALESRSIDSGFAIKTGSPPLKAANAPHKISFYMQGLKCEMRAWDGLKPVWQSSETL